VQVAAGSGASTAPPEVNALEIEYDERPEQIEEIAVMVDIDNTGLTDNQVWDLLRKLVGSSTTGPFKIQLPDDLPPAITGASGGGQKYAMLNSVMGREDLSTEVEGVKLVFSTWPEAAALSA
jgi:hypothetical protein